MDKHRSSRADVQPGFLYRRSDRSMIVRHNHP